MSVELIGDKALMKTLQTAATMNAHKQIVKKNGAKLQKQAMVNAVFVKGYSTGATKRSIKLEIEDGGYAARVSAGTEYSGYLEKGTRKMSAQPFMKPALDQVEREFIADLREAGIVK